MTILYGSFIFPAVLRNMTKNNRKHRKVLLDTATSKMSNTGRYSGESVIQMRKTPSHVYVNVVRRLLVLLDNYHFVNICQNIILTI